MVLSEVNPVTFFPVRQHGPPSPGFNILQRQLRMTIKRQQSLNVLAHMDVVVPTDYESTALGVRYDRMRRKKYVAAV